MISTTRLNLPGLARKGAQPGALRAVFGTLALFVCMTYFVDFVLSNLKPPTAPALAEQKRITWISPSRQL